MNTQGPSLVQSTPRYVIDGPTDDKPFLSWETETGTVDWRVPDWPKLEESERKRQTSLLELTLNLPLTDKIINIREIVVSSARLFSGEESKALHEEYLDHLSNAKVSFELVKSVVDSETAIPGKITAEVLIFAKNVVSATRITAFPHLLNRFIWWTSESYYMRVLLCQILNASEKIEIVSQGYSEQTPTHGRDSEAGSFASPDDFRICDQEAAIKIVKLADFVITRLESLQHARQHPVQIPQMDFPSRISPRASIVLKIIGDSEKPMKKADILDEAKARKSGISSNTLSTEYLPALKREGYIATVDAKGKANPRGRFYLATELGKENLAKNGQ